MKACTSYLTIYWRNIINYNLRLIYFFLIKIQDKMEYNKFYFSSIIMPKTLTF